MRRQVDGAPVSFRWSVMVMRFSLLPDRIVRPPVN
jgi:hypothetical protein